MGMQFSGMDRAIHQFDLEEALRADESRTEAAESLSTGASRETPEVDDAEFNALAEAKSDIESRLGVEQFWQDSQETARAQSVELDTGKATMNNVRGLDVGLEMKRGRFTGKLAVRMFVLRKEDRGNVAQGLLESNDVRTDVIEVGGDQGASVAQSAEQRRAQKPALCGSSVGWVDRFGRGSAGTIGCVCISRNDNYCLLSNTHVLTDSGINHPDGLIVHPGPADGGRVPQNVIGKVEEFAPLIPGGVSTVNAAVAVTHQDLVDPKHFTFTIDPQPMAPRIGQSVMKYGRTSGLTFGMITGRRATLIVQFSRRNGDQFATWYRDLINVQGVSNSFSQPGDAGALIVDAVSRRPVLLLSASASSGMVTMGHPMRDVMNVLGIQRLLNSPDFE